MTTTVAVRRGKSVSVAPSVEDGTGVKVVKVLTINRPVRDVYDFWRKLENLPLFLRHLESVTVLDSAASRWVVRTTGDHTVAWTAHIIEERPGELLSWRSLPDADVDNAGSVWFSAAPGGRGTRLKVALKYSPPGGKLGVAIAKLMGKDVDKVIEDDLLRLKSLLEAGEIPTTEGQPVGNQKGGN